MRSNYHLNATFVLGRRVWHIAFVLVDLAPVLFHSLGFAFVFWLMILAQQHDFLSAVDRHDGPAVSYVGDVAYVVYDQSNDGTGATSFDEVLLWLALLVGPVQKDFFSLLQSVFDSLLRVIREIIVSHNQLMELIP